MTGRDRIAALALPAGALAFCAIYPPEGGPRLLVCPFRSLTGLVCPLCGMTRAMASLGHGEWQKALAYHPLSPLAMAGLLLWFGWSLLRPGRPLDLSRVSRRVWISLGLALVAFNLLRWCGIIGIPRS